MSSPTLPNGLRDINRFITTHNSEGKAVYAQDLPDGAKWQTIGDRFNFFLGYTTPEFPVSLDPSDEKDEKSTPKDIVNYKKELDSPPGLAKSNGTTLSPLPPSHCVSLVLM
jgi:hypothetical protein